VICVVATPETDDINLLEGHSYAISTSGFKTLTLDMKKINVLGTFSLDSLKVYCFRYFYSLYFIVFVIVNIHKPTSI
jgi:hypothetical protein